MASNDIYKACARRVTEHHLACKSITDDIRAIREQVSGSSGPEKQNLEAMLEIRMQEKSDESRAGINAQIDLLNLVKDSDSTTVPGNILTELNRIFSGKGLDQLREQFEVDRDAAISGDGRLGRSNPNALRLPSRQTKRQTRSAVRRPLAEVSANIVPFDPTVDYVLDTPAPKRPRLKTPEELALTPATLPTNAFSLPAQIPPPSNGPRRSSRVSAAPKVNYFNDLADTRDDTKNSPDDVEPEDSSDEDSMSIIDTGEMFNEDAGVEDDSPSTPSDGYKYKAFTDENGLLQIGPQPLAPPIHINSGRV